MGYTPTRPGELCKLEVKLLIYIANAILFAPPIGYLGITMLIKRALEPELIEMSGFYPVVTVIGPRQSGKTTLVRALFKDKPYVSLENPDEREFATTDPRNFLAKYPDGAILDEIQQVPSLLSYIQGIVDEKKSKGMFILTGSHQLALHQSISQSLAGRTSVLRLLPLSITELNQAVQFELLDQYIYQGMYPRVYSDQIDPTKYYRDYVQTYIERDVRQLINVKDLSLFQKFIKLCAGRIGQLFNASNISNELGVSYHTIQQWLSILEASFVTFRLEPYFENLGKRITKSAKLYFTDVGLASYLLDIRDQSQVSRDPLRGGLAENFMVMEFIKNALNIGQEPACYFYRDSNNNEVDLVYKKANQLIPIGIKSSMTFHRDFMKGLNYFYHVAGEERVKEGYLVYAGEQEQQVGLFNVVNYKNIEKIVADIYA
ncbi:MAG: ATP-binding protein [Coxiellaceae bacterium]|nr:ATP-binding protein [Coxiellaceae bacterium]